MKTTLNISDSLLDEARKIERRGKTTLRALVEQGLRHVIRNEAARRRFRLRDASFGGEGLQPEFEDAGWEKVRGAIYENRGG